MSNVIPKTRRKQSTLTRSVITQELLYPIFCAKTWTSLFCWKGMWQYSLLFYEIYVENLLDTVHRWTNAKGRCVYKDDKLTVLNTLIDVYKSKMKMIYITK